MSTPNVKSAPHKAQPGVRKRITDLPHHVNSSDINDQPNDLDDDDGHVYMHLHTENNKASKTGVPARPMLSNMFPARSTSTQDLSTPTAMFVVYDSSELDAGSRSLLGKKLQCVAKST